MINWFTQSLIIGAIFVALISFSLRTVLGVLAFLRYQKAQTKLLAEIALKSNVDRKVVEKIIKDAKIIFSS